MRGCFYWTASLQTVISHAIWHPSALPSKLLMCSTISGYWALKSSWHCFKAVAACFIYSKRIFSSSLTPLTFSGVIGAFSCTETAAALFRASLHKFSTEPVELPLLPRAFGLSSDLQVKLLHEVETSGDMSSRHIHFAMHAEQNRTSQLKLTHTRN